MVDEDLRREMEKILLESGAQAALALSEKFDEEVLKVYKDQYGLGKEEES